MSDPATDEVMGRLVAAVQHIMDEAAEDIAEELREELSGSSPSAPGNPPGRDTGALQASVQVLPAAEQSSGVNIIVRTDTEYDSYLEKGTSKMAARPFAGPLEAKWTPIIENRLAIAARLTQI